MKKSAKVQKPQCPRCNLGQKRQHRKGVFYHTYKESNGVDWDSYTSLCSIQTEHGLEVIRAQALAELDEQLEFAKSHVESLKARIKEVRKATGAGTLRAFCAFWGRQ